MRKKKKEGKYMRCIKLLLTITAIVSIASTSMALPEMLDSFNAKYNTKGTALDTCDLCHITGESQRSSCGEDCHIPNQPQKIDPINLNSYGIDLNSHLDIPTDQALAAIEKKDSAGDGISNIDKIRNLTFPGDKKDKKKVSKNNLTFPLPPSKEKGNSVSLLDLINIFNNKI